MDQLRFISLWQRNVGPGAAYSAEAVFALLAQNYAHPARRYHNGTHIDQCLLWLDRYADWVSDPDAVELAIWFHDACYTPDPQGHERRAVKLLRKLAHGGLPADRLNKLCELILATAHQQAPLSDEGALLVDIDLASFARPWHRYVIDTAACRAERKQLDDREFCLCQVDFLQSMLERANFYSSQPFQIHHEPQARANMARMVELLQRRQQRLAQRRS